MTTRSEGMARASTPRKPARAWFALLAAFLLTACATNFTGSAHVRDGMEGCEAMCTAQGLEVAGMVMMGEYTDGCICSVPGREATALQAASAVSGSVVGVVMQMRSAQAQQQAQ